MRRAGCCNAPAQRYATSRPDLCCGFGGTFSTRQPEVSVAMADDKLAGAARRRRTRDRGPRLPDAAQRTGGAAAGPRALHLATALARGVDATDFCASARGLRSEDEHAQAALGHRHEPSPRRQARAPGASRRHRGAARARPRRSATSTIARLTGSSRLATVVSARGGVVHRGRRRRRRRQRGDICRQRERTAGRQVEVDGDGRDRAEPRAAGRWTGGRRDGSGRVADADPTASTPEHIVAPAIKLTRTGSACERARRTSRRWPGAMRARPRDSCATVFLEADSAYRRRTSPIAETGTFCLVTNEGNADLLTALPRVHVVVLGMERVVPDVGGAGAYCFGSSRAAPRANGSRPTRTS